MSLSPDEALHGKLVAVALVGVVAVITLTALFAREELQIVLYSAVYVVGVCAFWLSYLYLTQRSSSRREAVSNE